MEQFHGLTPQILARCKAPEQTCSFVFRVPVYPPHTRAPQGLSTRSTHVLFAEFITIPCEDLGKCTTTGSSISSSIIMSEVDLVAIPAIMGPVVSSEQCVGRILISAKLLY